MKELVLLRHAKSSWEHDVSDRNRPLNEKGIYRITNVASASAILFKDQDVIFSSPANRALHTASIMMNVLNIDFCKLKICEPLYTFDAGQLLSFIYKIDDAFKRVVCVGHNPAFNIVISYLSNTTAANLPTAAWAKIVFDTSKWGEVKNGICSLGLPKEILK
jgi:phosphohistidine phosphatase